MSHSLAHPLTLSHTPSALRAPPIAAPGPRRAARRAAATRPFALVARVASPRTPRSLSSAPPPRSTIGYASRGLALSEGWSPGRRVRQSRAVESRRPPGTPSVPRKAIRSSTPSGYSVRPPQSDPVVGTKLAAWHNPCHQGHSELSPCLEPPRNFPSSRPPFRASIPDLQAARPVGRRTQPAERAPEPQPTCAMHAPCWSTIVLSDGCDVLTASPESRALRTAPPERPPLVRAGQEAWSLSILN